jgi:uncharacterized damage-inducible protein DinB
VALRRLRDSVAVAVAADTLRTHVDYTAWATARLLAAATRIPPADLGRDFGTADKSVLGTLIHVFSADRVWLARIQGGPGEAFERPVGYDLARLAAEWPPLLARWGDWAAALTGESATARLDYTSMDGNKWNSPIWQIVLHVVNHGTHHRGQIAGFLRAMGHPPPALDLVAFYREIDPSQRR